MTLCQSKATLPAMPVWKHKSDFFIRPIAHSLLEINSAKGSFQGYWMSRCQAKGTCESAMQKALLLTPPLNHRGAENECIFAMRSGKLKIQVHT